MKKTSSSPVGCLVLLVIIVPPYFFLPWEVALGFSIVVTFLLLIVSEIIREIRKLQQRKVTNKSTIAAARPGFVELVAKVSNSDHKKSFLEEIPVDFHQLHIGTNVRTANRKSEFVSIYEYRSAPRILPITDGSGEAWASFHHLDIHLKSTTKRFKKDTLLQFLEEKAIPDFPPNSLEKSNLFHLTEFYLPKDEYAYFYGIMNVLPTHSNPDEILAYQGDKRDRFNNQYALTNEDWEHIKSESRDKVKLLTADYSPPTYIDKLIISSKGDRSLSWRTYLNVFMMCILIVVLLTFYGLYIWKAHPDLWNQLLSFFN
ncbi:hypothetical protein MATR_21980 [Marivirga tractuosa]|uniref:Uncharacterized protein n=1 Tax=Marivirga tractuosa (strain ATCC 23168 / DSM 4126 / NBRC 15989 / NCIMB 1408 / VKM B-1430 / H-43) TaxID=643867 RepID=E4TKK6_MARTH|nr:hypothetical protein [Marivirga tractuosa]ADR20186.1 hypothetical protein Ftrac_0175 [Marivirga tractuosa DSM 4126]BDD15373.1 hypothetical protein MATR_21980 [Marivirga tractuosa]